MEDDIVDENQRILEDSRELLDIELESKSKYADWKLNPKSLSYKKYILNETFLKNKVYNYLSALQQISKVSTV